MTVGNVANDSDHPETRLEKMNNMSMLESKLYFISTNIIAKCHFLTNTMIISL
jgi:hypothetical protein